MAVSHFLKRQKLTDLLLALPALTSVLELGSQDSIQEFKQFLEGAEKILLEFSARQAADVAASRATIAAVRLGEIRGSKLRQTERQVALQQVFAVRTALVEAVTASEQLLAQARGPVRQLVQLVAESGAFKSAAPQPLGFLVQNIWTLASQHEQLKPISVQIKAALDQTDILLLMGEEIDLTEFSSQT